MANLDTLIAEIWAASFLANLDNNLVFGNTINRDYQSDLSYGNVVNVDKIGAVTIGDYTKNTDMDAAEALTATQSTLTIDQQKYFNMQVDSIDEAQSRPDVMNTAMERAAYSMALVVDAYLASFYASAGNAIGVVGTPVAPDADTIYGYLTQAAQLLDEANAPTTDRYFVMSPAGIKLLRDSGEFLVATAQGDVVRTTGGMGGSAPMPNGYVGMAGGFAIWSSNNTASSGTSTSIWQAGHRMGVSMAESVNQIIGYQPELRFADAVRGLYVYGAAMLQPDAVVSMYTSL